MQFLGVTTEAVKGVTGSGMELHIAPQARDG